MKYLCGVIYGASGTGKTTLSGTLADIATKPLHLCIDRSAEDALSVVSGKRTVTYLKSPIDELEALFPQLVKAGSGLPGGCVWDSITQMITTDIDLLKQSKKYKNPLQAYGEVLERYRRQITLYASLPWHMLFLALADVYYDPLDVAPVGMKIGPGEQDYHPRQLIRPDIEGATKRRMGAYVNAMGYTYKTPKGGDATEYWVTFQHAVAETKFCGSVKRGIKISNPSIKRILEEAGWSPPKEGEKE